MNENEARARARELYASDECEIDPGASVVLLDEEGPTKGDAWVQAWLYVARPEEGEHQ